MFISISNPFPLKKINKCAPPWIDPWFLRFPFFLFVFRAVVFVVDKIWDCHWSLRYFRYSLSLSTEGILEIPGRPDPFQKTREDPSIRFRCSAYIALQNPFKYLLTLSYRLHRLLPTYIEILLFLVNNL